MPTTGLVIDERYTHHDTGIGHPERAERIRAISSALKESGLDSQCERIIPKPCSVSAILSNHDREYVGRLEETCRTGKSQIDCPDSRICPDTFEIALLAAGGVLQATERVATGQLKNAFCAIRPPGHHAEKIRSMGFCMFNNIAIAARHLLDQHDVERILIFDFDVHHGNGTQHVFEEDPRVFFCSFHGHPTTLYPGSGFEYEIGRGAGEGTILNVPFYPGSGDEEYVQAFRERFLPSAKQYQPQFILVSAGFDAHRADPLAQIELETSSFEWLTRELVGLADECCGGKLVSVLEGGYDLKSLGESAVVHLQELIRY